MKTVDFSETIEASDLKVGRCRQLIMPPTLKKLMGHIAFGVCVRGCVRALHLVSTLAPSFLIGFFILAGNEDNYKSLDKFEFGQNSAADFGVSCP